MLTLEIKQKKQRT